MSPFKPGTTFLTNRENCARVMGVQQKYTDGYFVCVHIRYIYIYPTNVHTEQNVLKNVGCCGSNSNGTLSAPTLNSAWSQTERTKL